jgi:hypothetical protein
VRKSSLAIYLLLVAMLSSTPSAQIEERAPQSRDPRDVNRDTSRTSGGNLAPLYGKSYALIIGIEGYDYLNRLPGVKTDAAEVERALKQHGFTVEVAQKEDLVSGRLYALIKEFVNRRGLEQENRLLIYYAGHGHAEIQENGGEVGYILPSDVPFLGKDPAPFRSKAISMVELLDLTKPIKAKHLLFVLDSCYAGSLINAAYASPARPPVVNTRPISPLAGYVSKDDSDAPPNVPPNVPPNIVSKASGRAHQIIASGTDRQAVPDNSEFRRKFVKGLTDESGQGADYDGDSYVTVSELGEYLQRNITNTSAGSQQPIWGFVGSKAANPGDFVFVMPGATAGEALIGPGIDPAQWGLPKGWRFEKYTIFADAPGLMLPRARVRHSFRDFQSVTRLKLLNNTAAHFILRAQNSQDYYLLRLTGGEFPDKMERFQMRAWVVRRGQVTAELTGSPLPVKVRELEKVLNYKDTLQVVITAEGRNFTVSLQSGEGKTRGQSLIRPAGFVDRDQTYRYGASGFLTTEGEQLQILSAHVYKHTLNEKGRQ